MSLEKIILIAKQVELLEHINRLQDRYQELQKEIDELGETKDERQD